MSKKLKPKIGDLIYSTEDDVIGYLAQLETDGDPEYILELIESGVGWCSYRPHYTPRASNSYWWISSEPDWIINLEHSKYKEQAIKIFTSEDEDAKIYLLELLKLEKDDKL